jgi:hypothetical protein
LKLQSGQYPGAFLPSSLPSVEKNGAFRPTTGISLHIPKSRQCESCRKYLFLAGTPGECELGNPPNYLERKGIYSNIVSSIALVRRKQISLFRTCRLSSIAHNSAEKTRFGSNDHFLAPGRSITRVTSFAERKEWGKGMEQPPKAAADPGIFRSVRLHGTLLIEQ